MSSSDFGDKTRRPMTLRRMRKGGSLPSSIGGTWWLVTLCVISFVSTSFVNSFDLCIFLDLLAMRHCFIFVVPDEAPNDRHLPAPKEEEDEEEEDDDHYDPDY
jgi:hypothetical protein